jgi:hypothetical protein
LPVKAVADIAGLAARGDEGRRFVAPYRVDLQVEHQLRR